MNGTFPPRDNQEPLPRHATTRGEAELSVAPSERQTAKSGLDLMRCIQKNSFAPKWLPEPLRHSLTGYLVATLLELVAMGMAALFLFLFPPLTFQEILGILGVALIGVGFGVGPSLWATLVGALLLYYPVLPPSFTWTLTNLPDTMGLLMYLVVGVTISLLTGRSGRALQLAEELARSLADDEARSRFDAQRLRAMLDVLPTAVLISSNQGQLQAMNQAAKLLWGGEVPLATDITKLPHNRVRWAQSGKPMANEEWTLHRALKSGKAVLNDEIEIETLRGQRKVVLSSAAPIRNETGSMSGIVISVQDISELRRLEREAAERAQELEAIFEAMTDGIAVLDSQGRLLRTNQAFRRLHGVERDSEYLTLPLNQRLTTLELRDEQGHPMPVEARPISHIMRGETLIGVDVKVTNVGGREVVLNVGGAPIRDQLGLVTGCVEVFRDVTARNYQEQRTRDTLGALVAMAEAIVQIRPTSYSAEEAGHAPSSLVADVTLPHVARRLAELTRSVLGCRRVSIVAMHAATGRLDPVTEVGLSPAQAQQWWASWSAEQSLEERYGVAIAANLYAGEPALLDAGHLPEESRYTLFQAATGRIVPMQLGEELVGILVVDYAELDHDYSREEEVLLPTTLARLGALVLERDRLLRGWAEARANELALSETKAQMDTFLGIASHELKTPLTSLKLSLQLSDRRLQKLRLGSDNSAADRDPGLQPIIEQLSRTAHQVARLERLVNDLLDVSRLQAGKLELHLEHADLAAIVHETVLEQREAVPDRRIHLHLADGKPVTVYADTGRIEQVVTNFLTNALKYSPPNRPVDVGVQVEQELARAWVHDMGPGLPPEEQARIWERFHRAKGVEVQSGTGVGLGLGLYISRMIVERHHGQVGVESSPGKGTTFWFTLPLTAPH